MDELEALWKHGGRTQVRRLSADEYGYEGLVRYLMKEKKKNGKRYGVTRGMSKYSVSVSDGKITRGRASKLVFGDISAKDFFEKNYPKYDFSDVEIKMAEDEYISGVYIYARLRLK